MNSRNYLRVVCLLALALIYPPTQSQSSDSITIATWNLEWYFDANTRDNSSDLAKERSAPSFEEWVWRRNAVSAAIAQMAPTVIGLQEIESRKIGYYTTKQIKEAHDLNYRAACIQGTDYYTEQDVAFLYQDGLVEFGRREQTRQMFASKKYYNLGKHLIGRFQFENNGAQEELTIVNVHLRANAESENIRRRQVVLLRAWFAEQIKNGENVIVMGDINTEHHFGQVSPESEIGILCGLDTEDTADDLMDLHQYLPQDEHETFFIPGKQFDRILVSRAMIEDDPARQDLVFQSIRRHKELVVRGQGVDEEHWDTYYDIPQTERDLSDHYPLMAKFQFK
ncbi:MAG: endonuclease/exonuclease/phosphatase family protein [Pirellulaceae bacterium]|nr:endonuclease/exonuclease/phosphatase family protein [Pirellulaceae bacterium]